MKTIRVVIIDSGVCTNHDEFKEDCLIGFTWHANSIIEGFEDVYGHGTAIYSIIRKIREYAEIINIKLNHIQGGANERDLLELLQYIYQYMEVDIVNISAGLDTCENYFEMEEICSLLKQKGIVVIAAFGNEGNYTYPATFSSVIGVLSDRECKNSRDFLYVEDEIVNLCARGGRQKVAWTDPPYTIVEGNSFACAHVTVRAIEYLYNTESPQDKGRLYRYLLDCFKSEAHSVGQWNLPKDERTCPAMDKVVIFPFNKEMHALIRFSHLLNFEIIDVFDTKYSGKIGRDPEQLIGLTSNNRWKIRNIDNLEWDTFDSIILGHLEELGTLINQRDLRKKLIDEATRRNKIIFSYDPIAKDVLAQNTYYPYVGKDDIIPNRMGMLYRISKPVIGIFGTSSSQGKYTLQITLGEKLRSMGYDVGQIGTEPNALLLGMDYVYPMGYNSGVELKEVEAIRYLNSIVHTLCIQDKDVIIAASQSGTVPYDMSNCSQLTIPQMIYLVGIQPDVVVLCINAYDTDELIRRTILFLESCTECKVIALVMYPFTFTEEWRYFRGKKRRMTENEFNIRAQEIEKNILLPVFLLEKDIDKLVEIILHELS